MGKAYSKDLVVLLNGVDLSRFCDTSEHHKKPDVVDVTTYGNDSHRKEGTLLDGTGSIGGIFDNTTAPASGAGPRAVINPLVGTTVQYIRRPEGTGVGKSQDKVNVVVGEYVETAPVADIVRWTLALEYDGDIDSTPQ